MGGDRSILAAALVGLLLVSIAAHALAGATPTPSDQEGHDAEARWTPSSAWPKPAVDPAITKIELEGLSAAAAPSGIPRFAVRDTADGWRYDVFVRFQNEPGPREARALAAVAPGPVKTYPLAESVHVRDVSHDQIETLLQIPGAVAVELERSVIPFLDIASATAFVERDDSPDYGARDRWQVEGRGSVIAVLDTGIDNEHPFFDEERFLGGYDATVPTGRVGDELLDGSETWTPLNERDPDDDHWRDNHTYGHGTHMASIALGHDEDGTYTGMAPAARFLDVKVISNTTMEAGLAGGPSALPYGWGSFVLEGMEFVHRYNRGESHLGDPAKDKVDVVLLALGETTPDPDGSSVLSRAVDRLVSTGVTVVAAAGNCGPGGHIDCSGENNTIVAPGAARGAITVGSMTHNGTVDLMDETLSLFSSRGPNGGEPKPNLVAYGAPIRAARGEPDAFLQATGTRVGNGTSQAAAQVAGIVALMLEVKPELAPADIKTLLMGTAREPGKPPRYWPGGEPRSSDWDERHGAGIVDALFAVAVALDLWEMEADDPASPDRVNQTQPPEENKTRRNQAPVVRYDHRPDDPVVGESVVFIDRSADPDADEIVSYRWDFGDGDTGSGARASHTYEREGNYRVVLTVTDVHGTAGSWDDAVRVSASAEVQEGPGGALFILLFLVLGAAAVLRRAKKGVALGRAPPPMDSS